MRDNIDVMKSTFRERLDRVLRAKLVPTGAQCTIVDQQETSDVAIKLLLKSGVLPSRFRRYQNLLIQLVAMQGVSNSAAARKLNVTRWTVAAWRERLGIKNTKLEP